MFKISRILIFMLFLGNIETRKVKKNNKHKECWNYVVPKGWVKTNKGRNYLVEISPKIHTFETISESLCLEGLNLGHHSGIFRERDKINDAEISSFKHKS